MKVIQKQPANIARIPPQNIEAEQAVLGTILLKGMLPENLLPDDFYKDGHRIIFAAMQALATNGKIDIVTVASYLRDQNKLDQVGGPTYIASLSNCIPSTAKLPYYAEIIRKKAVLRKIISASSETAALCFEEQGDVPIILAGLQRQIDEIQISLGGTINQGDMDANLDDLLNDFYVQDTHLKCLTEAIGGLPNDLIVIGAQSSAGKTSLNLGILKKFAIEDKQRVAYFGSSLRKEEVYFRLLCSMCDISSKVLKKIKRGNTTAEQRQALSTSHKAINEAPISIFTMPEEMSAMDISSKVRMLAREYGAESIGAVIIENLHQLTWSEPTRPGKETLDAILKHLKALAVELNIPVIISVQIDREIFQREDKRPNLGDLRGSGEIEALARLVLLLHWDAFYNPGQNDQNSDGWVDAEIIVYKLGIPITLHVRFNPLTFQWKDKD